MKKLLHKSLRALLVAAGLCVGASVWGDDLPVPVYFQDFESASTTVGDAGTNFGITGATLTGTGTIGTGDPLFGQYFQAGGASSTRENYLTLTTTAFSAIKTAGNEAATVSFWLNAHGIVDTNNFGSIFVAYGESGNSNHGYPFSFDVRANLTTHSSLWGTYFDQGAGIQEKNDWRTVSSTFADSWHHVAITYSIDKSSSPYQTVMKYYIDGTLVQTRNITSYSAAETTTDKTMFEDLDRLTEFVIGGNSPVWNDPDNGYAYDDIALYSSALTAGQIAAIINFKNNAATATIDFKEYAKEFAKGQQYFYLTSQTVTNADSETLYVSDDKVTTGGTAYTKNLYNYFAFTGGDVASIRHGSNTTGATSNTDGIWAFNQNYKFSIINLHPGDRVMLTWGASNTGSNGGKIRFRSTNVSYNVNGTPTAVTTNDVCTSGREYTVTSGTQLDFYIGGGNSSGSTYVNQVYITSTYDGVTNPSLAETAVEGTTKTITITNGTSSHGKTVTTYYTIDDTTPSSSNNAGSFTTSTQDVEITSSCTVKIVSESADGGQSQERSLVVEAGAKTPLNVPTATITAMSNSTGAYYPTYTFYSDNSDITGTPTADSYSYTFTPTTGSEETGTLTDGTFTFTQPGTIVVVAEITSDTYENSEPASVTLSADYLRTQYVDVRNLYDLTGLSATNGFYGGLDYDLIANVSFSPREDGGGCVFRGSHGGTAFNAYYGRNKGFTATVAGLTDGMVAVFANKDGNAYTAVTSSSNSIWVEKDGTLKYYSLFALPTITKTASVTVAGLATFTSDMSLDFSSVADKVIPYKATVEGTTVTLTKVTIVPAGEGVLLRSMSGDAVNVDVPVASYSAWTAAENTFVGTCKDITVYETSGTNTNFVLSQEDGVVGFFKAKTEENSGTAVGAGKAYLPVPTANFSAGARKMTVVFDDETTGINMVNGSWSMVDGYYDLQGRRVAQPTKGLYIVNGKKVVIK